MENETVTAFVGLGSNLGDRAGNLLLAVRGLLEAGFFVHKLSAIYETEPVGVVGHDNYLNMVAEIHISGITPSQMLARMLRIEYLLGRKHKTQHKPRSVDLDLLMFGDVKSETEFLILPHPRMHERAFVVVPLAEIAPHAVHPVFQKNILEIRENLADTSEIKRWNPMEEIGKPKIENRKFESIKAVEKWKAESGK